MGSISKLFAVLFFATLFSACGGGETYDSAGEQTASPGSGTGTTPPPPSTPPPPPETTTYSATLAWNAPVARADGTTPLSLAEIDGYIIHYGTTSRQYTQSVNVTDGTAVSYTINGLPGGTYYFAVVTYDINGVQSDYSTEASVTYN